MLNSNQPEHSNVLKSHSDTVSQLAFNSNNKELISSSYDNTLIIWDLKSNNYAKLEGHKSLINDVSVSPTGFLIASASSDCTVRIWTNTSDIDKSQSQLFKHNSLPVKSVDFSCDSKLIVTGSDDKTVKIIRVSDKKLISTFAAHTNWVKSVRFSHDSCAVVSASDDKTVKFHDVSASRLIGSIQHNGVVNSVRYHPDNTMIGTACYDKKVRLFDVRSKKLVQVYDQHKKSVSSLSFHPSGNYLASSSFDGTVKIFDLRVGEILFTITGHAGVVSAVEFSKFGDILATGGQDGIVNLWESNLNCNEDNLYANEYCREDSEETYNQIDNKNKENISGNSNTNDIQTKSNHINPAVSYTDEDVSEELSKVFERMVYQFELITNTFQNFESRLSKVEECIDLIYEDQNFLN